MIKEEDLRIDVYRTADYLPKTNPAVRITHIPTGLVEANQDSKSLLVNKENALKKLEQRVKDLETGS